MITIKRGATLRRILLWRNAATKVPVNLAGQTIYGQVRDATRVFVSTITINQLDQMLNAGKAHADFGNTKLWPVGTVYFDFVREVPHSDGAITVYSKTAAIKVERGITDV